MPQAGIDVQLGVGEAALQVESRLDVDAASARPWMIDDGMSKFSSASGSATHRVMARA